MEKVTQNKGFIYPNSMKFEYDGDEIYINAFDTHLNPNADEIPYECRVKIYPQELNKLIQVTKKLPEVKQVGIVRNDYGIMVLEVPLYE